MNIPMRDKEARVEDDSVNSVSLGEKRESGKERRRQNITYSILKRAHRHYGFNFIITL